MAGHFGTRTKRGYPRERDPTTTDIHWAAGIYEGEGTSAKTGGSQVTVVGQKDPWILFRLRAMFGGRVSKESSREMWRWVISGARGRGFLMTIYGLLSPRRQQQVRIALGKEAA